MRQEQGRGPLNREDSWVLSKWGEKRCKMDISFVLCKREMEKNKNKEKKQALDLVETVNESRREKWTQ